MLIFAGMTKVKYSLQDILSNLSIEKLNEMQVAALDLNSKKGDLILLAPTGSGKTIAYLMPLLHLLDEKSNYSQALIVVPSRELVIQIERVFKLMGTGLKITSCYGGHKREIEENNLVQPPAIVIGTPGRLCDHIRRGNINMDTIEYVALDEFDKILELGFLDEVSFIMNSLKNVKKKILTSATGNVEIPSFLKLDNAFRLNFISEKDDESRLEIKSIFSEDRDKNETLFRLLCFLGNRPAIIFCNHRESVERVSNYLTAKGIINEFYHGALEQYQRDSALCKFRNGTVNFLVTTDLAARGLDIPHIRYIIHYHLPQNKDLFTHRNGRTARQRESGTAIMILSPEEKLPPYINADIEKIQLPELITLPERPKWSTLFIASGKKNKINKIDIVGFLTKKGQLKKEDIGLIDVKDFNSFVAIRKSKMGQALLLIKNEKIKNKKVKIEVAK
jgi:superfamily II DNA/RNA helicase